MPSNIIAIVGATGKQGGSVATTYLSTPGWRVRCLTRSPTSVSAQALAARGAEIARADVDDVASLRAAFAGAAAVFAVTDFWTPMFDAGNAREAAARGVVINEWCFELEARRGRNLALAAAATDGLRRFVFSSLSDTRRWSGGKFTQNWHFDSKAAVERWIREDPEGVLGGLVERTSFLQVGWYVDNWNFIKGDMKRTEDGRWYHAGLGKGENLIPFVWTQRDTGPLVRALVEAEPGKSLLGYSELMSWKEYMKVWARVLGLKLAGDDGSGHKELSVEEAREAIEGPEELKTEAVESIQYVQEFGWTGGEPGVLHPKDLGADKYTTRVEDYISQEDWTPLLGGTH